MLPKVSEEHKPTAQKQAGRSPNKKSKPVQHKEEIKATPFLAEAEPGMTRPSAEAAAAIQRATE